VIKGRRLKVYDLYKTVPRDVKKRLEKTLYIDPEQDRQRSQIEEEVRLVRLRIAKIQFGVWYNPSNSSGQRRTFSVEHERDFLSNSAAYIYLVYEHKLIHIDVSATFFPRLSDPPDLSPHSDRAKGNGGDKLHDSCQVFKYS
jgi:RNA-dependent RNA polymerase